jgi:hypothetical protein
LLRERRGTATCDPHPQTDEPSRPAHGLVNRLAAGRYIVLNDENIGDAKTNPAPRHRCIAISLSAGTLNSAGAFSIAVASSGGYASVSGPPEFFLGNAERREFRPKLCLVDSLRTSAVQMNNAVARLTEAFSTAAEAIDKVFGAVCLFARSMQDDCRPAGTIRDAGVLAIPLDPNCLRTNGLGLTTPVGRSGLLVIAHRRCLLSQVAAVSLNNPPVQMRNWRVNKKTHFTAFCVNAFSLGRRSLFTQTPCVNACVNENRVFTQPLYRVVLSC